MNAEAVVRAAEVIRSSNSILFTAGAGMGVDSGLPDFRGPEGFWKAYPPIAKLGLTFSQMSTPRWFREDPELAWGFFGHRLRLYRGAVPHRGYHVLREWAAQRPHFVFTSNVDGQFEKAGFGTNTICECHGSINWLQCADARCRQPLWPAAEVEIDVDESTMRAKGRIPHCPTCAGIARPNVLMFGDGEWDESRTQAQVERLSDWLLATEAPLAIVELGAGKGVPTVRHFSENIASKVKGTLIRINLREADGPRGTISIEGGAAECLKLIQAHLQD